MRLTKNQITISLLGVLLLHIGCAPLEPSDKREEAQPSASPSPSDEPPGQRETSKEEQASLQELLLAPAEITYADVKKLVFEPSCVSCHNASDKRVANVNLETYAALLGGETKAVLKPFTPEESSVYETLLIPGGPRHMPPWDKPQLSDELIELVYHWINLGAKNKLDTKPERPATLMEELAPLFAKPEQIDYEDVNKHVLGDSCLECHSLNGSKPDHDDAIRYGQDMTTYDDLLMNNGVVKDKLADYVERVGQRLRKKTGSRVYKAMAIAQTMPPSKDGYLPMDSLRVKLMRLWIMNCAIEDFDAIDDDTLLPEGDELRTVEKIRDCTTI